MEVDASLKALIAAAYWKPTTCQGKIPLHEYILTVEGSFLEIKMPLE